MSALENVRERLGGERLFALGDQVPAESGTTLITFAVGTDQQQRR